MRAMRAGTFPGSVGIATAMLAAGVVAAFAGGSAAAPVAITGGTIHAVTEPPVENGVLVMDRGVILAVGGRDEVPVPAGAERIDASGLHMWPGMIDAMSRLGLVEVGSVRGTHDHTESGQMNPNARAEVAINVSSSHVPVTRANGILLAAVVPYGSMVPGTAAAIALDGWSWEEMVRRAPLGLVIQWPRIAPGKPVDDPWEEGEEKKRPEWEERLARLDEMLVEAETYERARGGGAHRDADVRWESLRSVVTGETPVWIQARNLAEIRSALDWTRDHGLGMVLVDGGGGVAGDAWRVADELAARDIPVVLKTTRLPARKYEPYDAAYTAPAKLHAAGVRIAFGSWSSAQARNLPQEAARAVAYGLPRRAAERALTLGAAEIFGLDDRYGSLEPGKSATLILTDGDLLEVRMHVRRAWIDGREVDLGSRHTRLWKKWSTRPMPAPTSRESGRLSE